MSFFTEIQDWEFFGRICSDYIAESDAEIDKLYKFLSAPIDRMTEEQKETRKKAILDSIQEDIDCAYG